MRRRSKISRRRWTDKEIQYLGDNYGTTPTNDIARHLHRTPVAIRAEAKKLNIRIQPNRKFTSEDIAYLTRNSSTHPASVIARHLGRHTSTIHIKIRSLGLPTFKRTKAEYRDSLYPDILRMVAEGATSRQIGERFRLTVSQVDNYLLHHNIIRKNFR